MTTGFCWGVERRLNNFRVVDDSVQNLIFRFPQTRLGPVGGPFSSSYLAAARAD